MVLNRTIEVPMIFWERQKVLTALYERVTKPVCEKYGLTQMEYDIVMFLHNNPQYETASDVVKVRKLTKSHVSAAIKLLENKGYLSKHRTDKNKKNIVLTLTDTAKNFIADGEKAQTSFGKIILSGFSESEKDLCRKMFFKMCENANSALEKPIAKPRLR